MPPMSSHDQNVLAKLNAIASELQTHTAQTEALRVQIEEVERSFTRQLDAQNVILTGNGSPERGVVVRLDRLEQDSNRRIWLNRVVISTSISALLGMVWNFIKGR